MNTIDDATVGEWLDLDLDGELDAANRARLAERLEASPELNAERRRLTALHTLLAEGRIPVRADFRSRVMASLPVAAWERQDRARSAWMLPVAAALVFGVGAVLVLALGGADAPELRVFGLAAAVVDFFATTLLAGSGLLFATWRGAGWVLETVVADSGVSLLALAALVVFLDLLFVSLLRRRRAAVARKRQ